MAGGTQCARLRRSRLIKQDHFGLARSRGTRALQLLRQLPTTLEHPRLTLEFPCIDPITLAPRPPIPDFQGSPSNTTARRPRRLRAATSSRSQKFAPANSSTSAHPLARPVLEATRAGSTSPIEAVPKANVSSHTLALASPTDQDDEHNPPARPS